MWKIQQQDSAWYRLWSAFVGMLGVFFGLLDDSLYQRTVIRNGVVALPVRDGQVYKLFVMKEERNPRAVARILEREMGEFFSGQSIVLTASDEAVFFRMVGSLIPHPSLRSSDRGWDLLIPLGVFSRQSEEYWDAFARRIYSALR
jgi:hypothetical protein